MWADYPEIAVYTVHPGSMLTPGAAGFIELAGLQGAFPMPDTVELSAATFLWLTARNAEFLSGRGVIPSAP